MTEEKNDLVNHPAHYEKCRIVLEPVDLTECLPHALASAIEYILRSPYKGSEKLDLQKAIWWLKRFRDSEPTDLDYMLRSWTETLMNLFRYKCETLSLLVTRDDGMLFVTDDTINLTIEKLEKRIAEIENDD
jgi:hypothetical protein